MLACLRGGDKQCGLHIAHQRRNVSVFVFNLLFAVVEFDTSGDVIPFAGVVHSNVSDHEVASGYPCVI